MTHAEIFVPKILSKTEGGLFLDTITIVDARMGRGKSSAAIQYMNLYKDTKRFLYVTPYLNEVDRICEQCDFEQPDADTYSKSASLKKMLREGRSIAATHALFYLLDDEALEIVSEKRYVLIVDESIDIINKVPVTASDMEIILDQMTSEDKNGRLTWTANDYSGKLEEYREIADEGSLFRLDTALIGVMSPRLLQSFSEVFMLTYLFDGQYMKAYLDFYEMPYRVVGIQKKEDVFSFSDQPDNPPPLDYHQLIHILDNPTMNHVGERRTALSKNWFAVRSYDDDDIRMLRNHMRYYFNRLNRTGSEQRLWTCFKDDKNKLIDRRTGRFSRDFLQIGARATNAYRNCSHLAYMINRFADPNMKKFFYTKGCVVDEEQFALSEMLQWIWRSAIRDDKPIDLYIPSSRMRKLLTDWMDKAAEGGEA